MSSRLETKRLSRKRLAFDRVDQRGCGAMAQLLRGVQDRGQRRAQVMADRRQQRGAQPIAFAHASRYRAFRPPAADARAPAPPGRAGRSAAAAGRSAADPRHPRARRRAPPECGRRQQMGRNSHSDAVSVPEPRPAGLPVSRAQPRGGQLHRPRACVSGVLAAMHRQTGGDRLRSARRAPRRCGQSRRRSRAPPRCGHLAMSAGARNPASAALARALGCGKIGLGANPRRQLAGRHGDAEQHDN